MKKPADFDSVFQGLRAILAEHEAKLVVQTDVPGNYYVNSPRPDARGRTIMFGAVRIGKNYVSFHLMPIYMNPKLQAAISPDLKKRMQGKSCFNFTKVEPELIAELKKLTEAGFEEFRTWPEKFGRA